MAFDEWASIGSHIARISNASAWWLGDWLIFGRRAYGDRYKRALETTQLDYQTLRNYSWVAGRFEASRRRESLSFQHHAELAALPQPEQDLWLERTERLGWSRNQLRKHLAAERRAGRTPGDDRPAILHLQVAVGREQRWRDAAIAAEQDLVDWIAAAADEAAEATLDAGSTEGRRVDQGRPASRGGRSARGRRLSTSSRTRRIDVLGRA
jgi:hypothetical protein